MLKILQNRFSGLTPYLALTAIGLFLIYATGFKHGLIFDDLHVFKDRARLSGAIDIGLQFRSLWFASYQVIHQFIGVDLYWQRVFNTLLHIANAFLLYALTMRLVTHAFGEEQVNNRSEQHTESDATKRAAIQSAAVAAVVFWAFNPVAVYAVQYLTQRSTLMATFFLLAAILIFTQALHTQTWWARIARLALTTAALIAAALSKEHAAPGFALLPLLYIYFRRPSTRELVVVGGPLVVLVLAAAGWMITLKGWSIGIAAEDQVEDWLRQLDSLHPGAAQRVYPLSLINQMWLYFGYGILWNVPWPGWLSVDMRPPFPLTWYALPHVLGAVAWVVSLVVGAWLVLRCRGRKSLVGVLLLTPAILFTTELAFVRLQEPFVLYRSYLWSIALPVLWCLLLLAIVRTPQRIAAVALVVGAIFAAISYGRIQSLRDDQTAWRDALEKLEIDGSPAALGRWRAPHNLAYWDLRYRRFDDALKHAQLADRLQAPGGRAKLKMGSALVALQRPQEALEVLFAALDEGYKDVDIWISIGSAYQQLGNIESAFAAYDRALQNNLSPRYRPSALLAAGAMANRVGRYTKAIDYFEELIKLQPSLPVAYTGLAQAYLGIGNAQAAIETLSSALQKTDAATLYHARAIAYLRVGDIKEAQRDIAQAVARDPRNPLYMALQQQIEKMLAAKPSANNNQ